MLGFPWTRRGWDSIFIVVDRFSEVVNLVACHETDDEIDVADLVFGDVGHLLGVPKTIVSNGDSKFLSGI